jgi:hypothetical protein
MAEFKQRNWLQAIVLAIGRADGGTRNPSEKQPMAGWASVPARFRTAKGFAAAFSAVQVH